MAAPIGPYTPIVRVDDWLICSGQLGLKDGSLVDGGVQAQARQALVNIATLLASEGAGLDAVVKTTVFMTHISDFALINEVYAQEFGDHRPARSAIAVAGLPMGGLVEIEAWARARVG
jgi:2-iminobutanoate/2-iminopropanoate deaminase